MLSNDNIDKNIFSILCIFGLANIDILMRRQSVNLPQRTDFALLFHVTVHSYLILSLTYYWYYIQNYSNHKSTQYICSVTTYFEERAHTHTDLLIKFFNFYPLSPTILITTSPHVAPAL